MNIKELAKAEFQKFSSEMDARMNLSNIEEKEESGAGSGIRVNGIKTMFFLASSFEIAQLRNNPLSIDG